MRKITKSLKQIDSRQHLTERRYLVLSDSYRHFTFWCRQYGVAPTGLTYIDSEEKALGQVDYDLIFIGHPRQIPPAIVARLSQEAGAIYNSWLFYPVTEGGKIVRWQVFTKGKNDG